MYTNQKGASYIAILIGIIGFALFAKIVIAVWAPYWDDRVINSQIEKVMQNNPKEISPATFISQMGQHLEMNGIRDVKFADIATVTNDGGLQVKTDYEVREPFLLNIDLVLKFEKSFDQSSVTAK